MKTITLAAPWTYRTALETIEYAPGKHKVSAEIADAHAKEMTNGSGAATPSTPGDPVTLEG